MAIRNPCGATRRPAPVGPERCGLPEGELPEGQERPPWGAPYGLAMTEVDGGWSHCAGGAVVIAERTAERHGGRSLHFLYRRGRPPGRPTDASGIGKAHSFAVGGTSRTPSPTIIPKDQHIK